MVGQVVGGARLAVDDQTDSIKSVQLKRLAKCVGNVCPEYLSCHKGHPGGDALTAGPARSASPCLNYGLKRVSDRGAAPTQWFQSHETSSLSRADSGSQMLPAEKVVASHFIQITEHFVCATLAHIFFNVPTLFAVCSQRNQRTKRPTTGAGI